jgi:hypothetical protein
MRLILFALSFFLTFAAVSADPVRDETAANLAKMKFPSDQQKLLFLGSEIQKVEREIVPPKGTPSSVVDRRFGTPKAAVDIGGAIMPNRYDYPLTDDALMDVIFTNGKVKWATIIYSSAPKQRRLTNDIKTALSDWTMLYVSSQVLLKAFKPRS